MKKPLLDVILTSEKRKQVLLMLQDGPKEMEFLLNALNTTRTALLPQMKVLEEHYLVNHYKDAYELTTIGKLVLADMKPLLDTIAVFDSDINYWGTHDFDFIPPYLLGRISKLVKCKVINPPFTDIYNLNEKILETSLLSKSLNALSTFYHPDYPRIFTEMMQNNVHVHLVITPKVLDKLQTERIADFEELLKNKLFHLYVCSVEMGFLAVVYNDHYLLIRPLKSSGEFDVNHILCSSPEALEWANDLFEYYLSHSTLITEI